MGISSKEVKLRVAEVSHQRDVGRWKVRIDAKTMEYLEVAPGDIIGIKGKRSTAAVVWPAYPEDAGKNLIRMDGITRKNAGVSMNECVSVRKAVVREAQSVTLAPVNVTIPGVDQSFYEFVKNRILEAPVVAGDTIQVSIFGSAVHFRVTKTIPHGIVVITSRTNVQVLSEPVPEEEEIIEPVSKVEIVGVEDLDSLSISLERKELEVLFNGSVEVTCSVHLNFESCPSAMREGVLKFLWKEEELPRLNDFLKDLNEFAQKELKVVKEHLIQILAITSPITIDMGKLFDKLTTSLKSRLNALSET